MYGTHFTNRQIMQVLRLSWQW